MFRAVLSRFSLLFKVILIASPFFVAAQEPAIERALNTPASQVDVGVIKANLFLDRHLRDKIDEKWDPYEVILRQYGAMFLRHSKKVVLAARFEASAEPALDRPTCKGLVKTVKAFVSEPKVMVDLDERILGELFGYHLAEDPALQEELANDVQFVAHVTSKDEASYVTCVMPYGSDAIVYSE